EVLRRVRRPCPRPALQGPLIPAGRGFSPLDLLQGAPGGVGVELSLVDPLLGLLHRLPGPLELGPLALEPPLGGRQPALGLLAVLRPLPAVAALLLLLLLGAGRLALRRGRRRRTDQPDRGRAAPAGNARATDRLAR